MILRMTLIVALASMLNATEIEQFVESFDGNGEFDSTDGLIGFDNPEWTIVGSGEFRDGGLWFENNGIGAPQDVDADRIFRRLNGKGSFVQQVYLSNISIDVGDFGDGGFGFRHNFTTIADGSRLAMSLFDDGVVWSSNEWQLTIFVGRTAMDFRVPVASDIALTIAFDESASEASFSYDVLEDGRLENYSYGPFPYEGSVSESQSASVGATAAFNTQSIIKIDHWSLLRQPGIPPGDFDQDGVIDVDDINLLTEEIRRQTNDPAFDILIDGIVDEADRNVWVDRIANTFFGDSNLDGEFNSSDLIIAFVAGKYEDGIAFNSTWDEGDWDGNGEFNSRDLVFAFQDGGYEAGPRTLQNVPEPTSSINFFCLTAIASFVSRLRRGGKLNRVHSMKSE